MLSFHSYWTYSKASHIWSKLTAPILHAVILGQGGAIWNFNKNRKTKKGAVGVFRIWAVIKSNFMLKFYLCQWQCWPDMTGNCFPGVSWRMCRSEWALPSTLSQTSWSPPMLLFPGARVSVLEVLVIFFYFHLLSFFHILVFLAVAFLYHWP